MTAHRLAVCEPQRILDLTEQVKRSDNFNTFRRSLSLKLLLFLRVCLDFKKLEEKNLKSNFFII